MIKNFIKRILSTIDSQFKTSLFARAITLDKAYYSSSFLNAIRRSTSSTIVKWKYKIWIKDTNPLRLHIGCGDNHIEGYVNIDLRKTRATDLVCDIRKLPYPDNSVALIETYHVVDHIPRHDLPNALKEWHRLLIRRGKLIIECPDFDEDVKEYMGGNEKRIDSIFLVFKDFQEMPIYSDTISRHWNNYWGVVDSRIFRRKNLRIITQKMNLV